MLQVRQNGSELVFAIGFARVAAQNLENLVRSAGLAIRLFESIDGFLDACNRSCSGCVLMPSRTAIECVRRLRTAMDERGIDLPIVLVGEYEGDSIAAKMHLNDIVGMRWDFTESEGFVGLIGEALAEHRATRREQQRQSQVRECYQRLSHRERQVMQRVVHGMLNKQVAAELGLSPKTVEVHRAHVMEKMEAESLASLVRKAVVLEEAGELYEPVSTPEPVAN